MKLFEIFYWQNSFGNIYTLQVNFFLLHIKNDFIINYFLLKSEISLKQKDKTELRHKEKVSTKYIKIEETVMRLKTTI